MWLNAPFSYTSAFVDKLIDEYDAGRVSAAILLTNAYTANKWWQKVGRAAGAICLTRPIQFEREDGGAPGKHMYGGSFFFFGGDAARFIDVFSPHGVCMVRA